MQLRRTSRRNLEQPMTIVVRVVALTAARPLRSSCKNNGRIEVPLRLRLVQHPKIFHTQHEIIRKLASSRASSCRNDSRHSLLIVESEPTNASDNDRSRDRAAPPAIASTTVESTATLASSLQMFDLNCPHNKNFDSLKSLECRHTAESDERRRRDAIEMVAGKREGGEMWKMASDETQRRIGERKAAAQFEHSNFFATRAQFFDRLVSQIGAAIEQHLQILNFSA